MYDYVYVNIIKLLLSTTDKDISTTIVLANLDSGSSDTQLIEMNVNRAKDNKQYLIKLGNIPCTPYAFISLYLTLFNNEDVDKPNSVHICGKKNSEITVIINNKQYKI